MANAFHAIAAQSGAATSSSKKPCYDVFINHHGKDVKQKIASTLYNMFDLVGVQAFLDQEELELGDSFPEAIEGAMRSASVHIAIFSPRYAESPWCLAELSFMLQIKHVTIIPVFYEVNPSDLRHEKGFYADALVRHRTKRRYDLQKIEEWKKALSCISYLSGSILYADTGDEGKLLRTIVDSALSKIEKVPLEVAMFPVGLEEAVQDFECKVGFSSASEDVHIVGIVGMGGSGKTTLAKELYNRKSSSTRRSCLLFNVRDASSKSCLHNLQEKLMDDLHIQHSAFDNIEEGKGILARGLRSITVLIVLDDVDDVEQIYALLPPNHKLGGDSFIIVTTRQMNVLTSCGISSIYPMKLLDPFSANKLFCRHAFLRPYSKLGVDHLVQNDDNFQNLIERFVIACNGLPLSLKVFGAMVNGKSKECWESQLQKISRILPNEISKHLQLSYDALDSEEREMFLDIACFFIGGNKSRVISIWDGSGWSGVLGWETLVNKCLVGLDEDDCIDMHDHLRDLGREIARHVSPSRIWEKEQIGILGGNTPIRGIVAAPARSLEVEPWPLPLEHCIKRPSLPKLQLLVVRGNDFREEFAALSRDLVSFRWYNFNGSSLPSWLSLANLRVLELYKAANVEELWHDNVQLPLQLRELTIDLTGTYLRFAKYCISSFNRTTPRFFRGLPRSIGRLKHLKKLVLIGMLSTMRSLPEEFCQLQSLEILTLSCFQELSSLPDDFGNLRNLRTLKLNAVQLTTLPDSFKQLTALQSLDLSSCYSLMFTSEMLHVLEFMTKLQVLRIFHCPQSEELPHLTTQASLRMLQLEATGIRKLPNIGQLTKLETLILEDCGDLSEIETLPENVRDIMVKRCQKMRNMSGVGGLPNLQSLVVKDCPDLEVIPCPSYMHSNGHKITIEGCPKLVNNN